MFFEVILIGEREIELHSAEIKCGKVFKCGSELVDENEGHGVGGGAGQGERVPVFANWHICRI